MLKDITGNSFPTEGKGRCRRSEAEGFGTHLHGNRCVASLHVKTRCYFPARAK